MNISATALSWKNYNYELYYRTLLLNMTSVIALPNLIEDFLVYSLGEVSDIGS
jgi:hypothetical protein